MTEHYYKILDIPPGASKEQIRQAYHKLAKRYHPDHNNGDADAQAKFLAINEAYQVLSDTGLVYYERLGVTRTTPLADIKRAYYRLHEKFYPAAREGDTAAAARLAEIKNAYVHLVGKEDTANLGEEDKGW